MIVQLTGVLASIEVQRVVLDVGGIGFELGVSSATLADLPERGTPGVMLYVRMRTNDQGSQLFGFSTKEERTFFDKLVQISGVGPRVALSVLSSLKPKELAYAVQAQDIDRLVSVPGVGKKTAARLLVELEGLISKDAELKSFAQVATLEVGRAAGKQPQVSYLAGATEALLSMGFNSTEAEVALEGVQDHASTEQEAIRYALKRLGGGV